MSPVRIITANLDREEHARDIRALTAAYASDPMGNDAPLPPEVLERLVPGLRAHPTTLVLLAYAGDAPAGIATCFFGFSTFAAAPLINIHDLAVVPEYRGRGIARRLLAAVEQAARERKCVKITLEVRADNTRARELYRQAGFLAGAGDPGDPEMYFCSRFLAANSPSRLREGRTL